MLPNSSYIDRGELHFVGRHAELMKLHQALQKRERGKIVALTGMAGVGKTSLAQHYAQQHRADYPGGIYWFADRDTNLGAEIVQFAQLCLDLDVPQSVEGKALSLVEQVEWCWQHWLDAFPAPIKEVPDLTLSGVRQSPSSPHREESFPKPQTDRRTILIVVDCVSDWEDCQPFLPADDRFRTIVCARRLESDLPSIEIPLTGLLPTTALQLLSSRTNPSTPIEVSARQLCQWLGYLPLSLQLVWGYLSKHSELSWQQILQQLRQHGDLIDPSSCNAQRGLQAILSLLWQDLTPMAQHLALLMSLFAPTAISWDWIVEAAQSLGWETDLVEPAREQLLELQLLQTLQPSDLRSPIRQFVRSPIRQFWQQQFVCLPQIKQEQLQQAVTQSLIDIARKIPQSVDRELSEPQTLAIPHLAEIAQNLIGAVKPEDLTWPFIGLARFYANYRLYELAEYWSRKCLAVVKLYLGVEHPDVASCYNNLAYIYKTQGRYQEAEALYLQALEIRACLFGESHPDVAIGWNNLAALYHAQERYAEAESLYLKTLELRRRLLGDEHESVATTCNNLAALYNAQQRYEEAGELYFKAWDICRRTLGLNSPKTQQFRRNLELFRLQNQISMFWQRRLMSMVLTLCVMGLCTIAIVRYFN
jgi:tetratricopeptide (TPR) repeat protein/energy-coupling factor transporter ATP-binding protein EcfA2